MSRLIKSTWSIPVQSEKKVISIKMLNVPELVGEEQEVSELQTKTPAELLNEARMAAEQIHRQVKMETDSMYAQIKQERDLLIQEKEIISKAAKEEGYLSGWEEGKQQGYAEYQELLKEARQIIEATKTDCSNYLEDSEKTILNLAIKVAEKIIGSKLAGEEDSFLTLVKRALKEAKDYHDIQLHVNPRFYEYILSQKDELLAIFSHETSLFIFPDEDLSEDGCVIESGNGRIDASIDTQLSEIKQKLTELLESEIS